MDRDKDHIIMIIYDFNDLLHLVPIGYTNQSTELSYAMIKVNNIITYLELLQFLKGKSNFTVTRLLTT